ncbi:hypothetical protein PWG71_10695 [Nocardiopsis sp. N85]|uniref:SCO4225 family membrane protein n=1 Tax=Nocardiopsis sp. N85 TaxID=3029400 RepID=UPI00237F555A|nr:hypothetical protein [Nocardiopsis sp. N85]MDE3721856.1 hypothetical protein [Nocardiopsis sp. N85]
MKNLLAAAVDNTPSRLYLAAAALLLGWAAYTHLGPGFPETSMPEIALAAYLLPCSVLVMSVFSLFPEMSAQTDPVVLWSLFVLGAFGNALLIGAVVRGVRRLRRPARP